MMMGRRAVHSTDIDLRKAPMGLYRNGAIE